MINKFSFYKLLKFSLQKESCFKKINTAMFVLDKSTVLNHIFRNKNNFNLLIHHKDHTIILWNFTFFLKFLIKQNTSRKTFVIKKQSLRSIDTPLSFFFFLPSKIK